MIGVSVNGVPHQNITALVAPRLRTSRVRVPYLRVPRKPATRLVIGAGDGVDVALALRRGATQRRCGRHRPPAPQTRARPQPRQALPGPAGERHVDDGRAWLQRTDRTYDTVIFALPDSLTLIAGSGQVRLESYLFTAQALQAARARLRPGGVFAMYNAYRESWLVDRYIATVTQAFGHRPCVDLIAGNTNAVIVAAVDAAAQDCSSVHPGSRPLTRALVAADRTAAPAPVSDDRPFPYLLTPSIPSPYLLVLLGILLVSRLPSASRGVGRPGCAPM